MSSYTPGPWKVDEQGAIRWHKGGHFSAGVKAIAVFKRENGHGTPVAWVRPYGYKYDFLGSPEADARLIAQAPALYKLLKGIVALGILGPGLQLHVEGEIAKVEGGE